MAVCQKINLRATQKFEWVLLTMVTSEIFTEQLQSVSNNQLNLGGHKFKNDRDLWKVATRRMIRENTDWYQKEIDKFASRYDKCMSRTVWKNSGISPWIPWSRFPLCNFESSSAIQEIPGIYGTRVHHRVHKSPTFFSVLDRVGSIHNDPTHFLKIYFKTFPFYT